MSEQLIPSRLAKFSDKGLSEEFEKWHGLECVECESAVLHARLRDSLHSLLRP